MPDETPKDPPITQGTEQQAQPAYAAPELAETRPTEFIPYRGAEQHGVPFHGPIPPDPEVTGIVNPDAANVLVTMEPDVGEHLAPVPVIDVSETPNVRRMFVATSITIPAVALHPSQATPRILMHRMNRTKAKISTKKIPGAASGPDRIWLSESESPSATAGNFPLDTAEIFETNTTEDIYAVLDTPTNGALICVYEEYEIPA